MKEAVDKELIAVVRAESSDGVALVTDPENNPICSVTVNHSDRFIFVQWKQYASSAQLRFIHEHIIELVEQHHIKKLLGDDALLPTIHSGDQKWITEDWLPRARAAGLA